MASSDRTETIRSLSIREILEAVPHRTFKTGERRCRANLEAAIYNLPQETYDFLVGASVAKRRRLESTVVQPHPVLHNDESSSSDDDDKLFFETVSEECRRKCIADFIDATGSQAMASSICAVCAGSFFQSESDFVSLSLLRETGKLKPSTLHPAHVLTEGMLLHRNPCCFSHDNEGCLQACVCYSCLSSLNRNKTPPLSLANGLWIGDVPLVLRLLTLPERILVARFFPAAYIVKLYPAKKGARSWPSSGFHSGIRGNVSTYRLNTEDIAKMTDSQVMPPSSTILAATIGVTFVGPRNLPQKTMPGFLRVNRRRVHDALLWLKENNPIYENILISHDRLNELPVDDVPFEIMSLMKHSDNIVRLNDENDGYVPDSDDESDTESDNNDGIVFRTKKSLILIIFSSDSFSDAVIDDGDASMAPPSDDAFECTIPLQALGVVDVAANEVPDNELLANALANISRADKIEGWAVRRSSEFVNEYPRLDEDGNRFPGTTENPNHLLGSFLCLFPYGVGGFEVSRDCKVSYEMHARWALRYEDRRFRTDLHFVFQIFGVIQKHCMCASAALQISKQSFLRFESAIRNLDSAAFDKAAKQEHARESFTDPTMKSLRDTITTVRTKVEGTDEARVRIRSLIWGMCIKKNPPSLWLTINPADTQNPIARMFAGEDIDLDHFCALDHHPIAGAVAGDPFASALFFHTIINAVIRCLLGIHGYERNQTLYREKGIFGSVSAFIGTVKHRDEGPSIFTCCSGWMVPS